MQSVRSFTSSMTACVWWAVLGASSRTQSEESVCPATLTAPSVTDQTPTNVTPAPTRTPPFTTEHVWCPAPPTPTGSQWQENAKVQEKTWKHFLLLQPVFTGFTRLVKQNSIKKKNIINRSLRLLHVLNIFKYKK